MANIGKYRIEEEIGRGGFGQVYRAFDPSMSRRVAIKILLSQKDPDLLARFKNEANATGKLRHRNIVTVYDYGEYDNKPYLVMEFLEGEDLQMIVSSNRNLSLLEKTSIMTQVAEGLQHAHHNGIVHRDVKPANIMILKDGTAKIMDFGIARAVVESARLTQHGSLLGTLSYMAPEVFQGTDVDHLCDIFSLGVIFYELITSKHPFAADAAGRVIYNITSVNPPGINTLVSDCPEGLDQIISRAIHKERELRYQSMDDLLLDLAPIRLQLQSNEARTLIQKAEALLHTQQISGAQEILRQALLLDPHNRAGRNLREKITREANRQLTRDRCDQLMASAEEHFAAERYPKTIEVLESLIRLDPDRTEAVALIEKARAAERKRQRVQALIAKARRELDENKLTGAYQSILECFHHAPENKEAVALMETIRSTIERRERERRLAESLSRVEELIASEEHEEAESLLSDLEVNYPGATRVRQLAADVRQAIREKKRRNELAVALEGVRPVLGERRWQEALTILRRLDSQFPGEADLRSMIGYAEAELQAQEKADYIERIGRETRLACESRDFDHASRLLKDALVSYPGEPAFEAMMDRTGQLRRDHDAWVARQAAKDKAEGLASAQNFVGALAEIDRVLQTQESADLRELRARILTQRQEHERAQAIKSATSGIETLIARNKFQEATALAAKSLNEFPGEPSVLAAAELLRIREAEHIRKTRIASVADQARKLGKEQQFGAALAAIDNALREFVGDSTLLSLRQRIYSDEQEYRRKALAQSANAIKERIERQQYQDAIKVGKEALQRFQGETIIAGLLDVAELALAEEKRAVEISNLSREAEGLALRQDFDGALQLIRETLGRLGSDASLESLEEQVEKQRAEHERQKAVATLLTNARNVAESGDRLKAIAMLQEGRAQEPEDSSIQIELVRLQREEERDRAIEAAADSARKHLQSHNSEAALTTIRLAIEKHGNDPRLSNLNAAIKATIAEKDKERAIRGALQGAGTLEQQGHLDGAAELLEQALVKAAGDPGLTSELERVRAKIARQAQLDAILDKAHTLITHDQLADASKTVKEALAVFPGETALSGLLEEITEKERRLAAFTAMSRIDAVRSTGDLEGALRVADEILAAYPGEVAIQNVKSSIESEIAAQTKKQKIARIVSEAHLLLDQQKVAHARNEIEAGLKEYPGDPELTALLSYSDEILAARHRADAISQLARKAKKLIQDGKPAEAEKLLAEGITQYPGEESLVALAETARADSIARQRDQKVRKALNSSESHRKKKHWSAALAAVDEVVRDCGPLPALLEEREIILSEQTAFEKSQAEKPTQKDQPSPKPTEVTQILKPGSHTVPASEKTVIVSRSELNVTPRDVAPMAEKPGVANRKDEPVDNRTSPAELEVSRRRTFGRVAAVLVLVAVLAIGASIVWTFSGSPDDAAKVEPPREAPKQLLAASILHFYADPSFVSPGGKTTICYGVENADALKIEPAIVDLIPSSNQCFEYQPQSTQEYKLTVRGPDGVDVSQSFSVAVETQPLAQSGQVLIIAGESGADVIVDGKITGRRTGRNGSVQIALNPGRHQVTVEKEGFVASRGTVTIAAGEDTTLNAPLKAKPTQIILTGAPVGASVTIDGISAGVVPPNGGLPLTTSAGNHLVVLRKEGFLEKSLNVSVDLGQSREVAAADLEMSAIPRSTPPPPQPTSQPPLQPAPQPPAAEPPAIARGETTTATSRTIPDETSRLEAERAADFARVDHNSITDLEAFIDRHPNSAQAKEAQTEIARLRQQQTNAQRRADMEAVLRTLDQFSGYYQAEDMQGLSRVFPSMTAQQRSAFQNIFSRSERITYRLRATTDPTINGDIAEVDCVQEVTYVSTQNRTDGGKDPMKVTLRRINGAWFLQSLQAR